MKTTQKHYDLFRNRVEFWINIFGLSTWCPVFTFAKDKENAASILADLASRNAVFNYSDRNDNLPCELTKDGVDANAFHEVCELILWHITEMLRPYYSDHKIDAETHKVIQHLDWAIRKNMEIEE